MEATTLTPTIASTIVTAPGPVTPEALRAATYLGLIESPRQRRTFIAVDILFVVGAVLLSGWPLDAGLFAYVAAYLANFQHNVRTIHAARLYATPELTQETVAEVNTAHAHATVSMALVLSGAALVLSLLPVPLTHCVVVGYGVVLGALWIQGVLLRRRCVRVRAQATSQPWYPGFVSTEDQRMRSIAEITSNDLGPAPADLRLPADPFGSDYLL